MKKFIYVVLVILAVLIVLGRIGAMDQQDAIDSEIQKCEFINKGLWGADKETRQRCKLTKGE